MKLKDNDLKIFLMIIVIITSLLVLTIYERYILSITSKKKSKINVLYYNRVLNTLYNGKIILITTFCTIFVILINPISLIRVFNPYIFNIFGDQFGQVIKYITKKTSCVGDCKAHEYIQHKDNQAVFFDKTLNEIVFNKSNEKIYERIKNDFNDNDKLCKLAKSIKMDNLIFKLKTSDIKNIEIRNEKFIKENPNLETVTKFIDSIKDFNNRINDGTSKVFLDETRSSKFKLINDTILSKNLKEYTKESDLYLSTDTLIILLLSHIVIDTISQIVHVLRLIEQYGFKRNKNSRDNQFLVYQGKNYYVQTNQDTEKTKITDTSVSNSKTFFLIYHIIYLFIVSQILNNEDWLSHSGLISTESKKSSILILFIISYICKAIFTYNRYVLLDTYFLINLVNFTVNVIMALYIKNYYTNKTGSISDTFQLMIFGNKNDKMESYIFTLLLLFSIIVYGMYNKHHFKHAFNEEFDGGKIRVFIHSLLIICVFIRLDYINKLREFKESGCILDISTLSLGIKLDSLPVAGTDYKGTIILNVLDLDQKIKNYVEKTSLGWIKSTDITRLDTINEDTIVIDSDVRQSSFPGNDPFYKSADLDIKQLQNIIRLHYLTKTDYNLVNIVEREQVLFGSINLTTYYVIPYIVYIIYIVVFCFYTTISYMKSTYSVPWLLIHFLSQPTQGIIDLFLGFPQFISHSDDVKKYNDSYWVAHIDLIRYIILTINIYLIPSYIQYILKLGGVASNLEKLLCDNSRSNLFSNVTYDFSVQVLFIIYFALIFAVVASAFLSAFNQHGHYIALLIITGLTILTQIISRAVFSYNEQKYPPEFDYIFSFSFGEYWTLYYVCIIVLLFMMPITSKLDKNSESEKILRENFNTINNITIFTQNKKYLAVLILILLIILTIINSNNKNSMYSGGGIGINTFNNKLNFLFGIILLYIIYKTYSQSNIHTNKKKNKIKGGSDLSFEVKTTDQTDSNIVFYVSCIVALISLYMNNLVYSNDIINYINNKFLNYSNLNNLRLLVFPITVIIIFLTLFGYPFIKTFIVRQIEQESVINIEKYDTGRGGVGRTGAHAEQGIAERQLEQKYSNKLIDNDEKNILTYHSFIGIKYTSYIIIILWYTYLFYSEKIELNTMLLFNLVILYIYFYFIQYVVYIFFKIYMNENVNKIDSQVKTINKIKTKIKFVEGKINPVAFEEIVEINSSKLKEQYEEFINTLFRNLKDILRMNNLNNLTTAIEQLIMTRLANNKKLKDDFDLEQSIIENRKIEMEKRRKLNVKKPLPPIPENQIMKLNLSGKWTNIKDENYIILYVYNSNAMVLYFNKTQYQGFKLMEIHQKSGLYEFIYKNELEFSYDNKNIIINGIPHSKLSDEFATPENIIKKTLNDNNIFKSLNYMVSIDEDAEFIGKYKLVENITNYNNYKGNNDKLSLLLEQMIMNKILLIKSIKNKKYKQAHVYSQEIDKLEKQYKKREAFYKFDTDNDGIISIDEIQNHKKKNHKLSDIGEIKIVSAVFDGTKIILRFDKNIPTAASIVSPTNFKILYNNINIAGTVTMTITGDSKDGSITWTTGSGADAVADRENLKNSNKIEIKIVRPIIIDTTTNAQKTLKVTTIKVHKRIDSFNEFDPTIFDP